MTNPLIYKEKTTDWGYLNSYTDSSVEQQAGAGICGTLRQPDCGGLECKPCKR